MLQFDTSQLFHRNLYLIFLRLVLRLMSDIPTLFSSHSAGLRQSTAFCMQILTGVPSSNLATKTESHCFYPAALTC